MIAFTYYKKVINLWLIVLLFSLPAKAQTLAEIRQSWEEKDLARAKDGIESYLQENTEDVSGWLLKAVIFNALSGDDEFKALVADGRMDALNALQKAVQLDRGATTAYLKQDSFKIPFQIYNGYTKAGMQAFNAGEARKENYAEALKLFKKADRAGRFIFSNGWGLQAIDTANLYYSAITAIRSEKEDDALLFGKRIIDSSITKTQDGKDFQRIYEWVAFTYATKNKQQELERYTLVGSKTFPRSDFFRRNYIEWLRAQKDYTQLFPQYDSLFARGFTKAAYRYAYVQDIFNYLYADTQSIVNNTEWEAKLKKSLTIYIKANPLDVNAKLLFAKFYINKAVNVQKQIVVTSDKTMQAKLKATFKPLLTSSNQYLKTIVDKFPSADPAVYNEALELLIKNYTALGNTQQAIRYSRIK